MTDAAAEEILFLHLGRLLRQRLLRLRGLLNQTANLVRRHLGDERLVHANGDQTLPLRFLATQLIGLLFLRPTHMLNSLPTIR